MPGGELECFSPVIVDGIEVLVGVLGEALSQTNIRVGKFDIFLVSGADATRH